VRKIYRTKNIVCNVDNEEQVRFEVKFISSGNSGLTAIDVSSQSGQEIRNAGTVQIGKGRDLKAAKNTTVFSDINNLAAEVTDIIIEYLVNGKVIHRHENKKSEADQPTIILLIKFI
jgi:hypothetical protein